MRFLIEVFISRPKNTDGRPMNLASNGKEAIQQQMPQKPQNQQKRPSIQPLIIDIDQTQLESFQILEADNLIYNKDK